MSNYCLILSLLCAFLSSCKSHNKEEFVVNSKTFEDSWKYKIKIDSIEIPIEGGFTPYYTYTNYSENNIDYFLGYNPLTSTIDIFDLTHRLKHKELSLLNKKLAIKNLDKKDLDKGRSITDIAIINFDSILLNDSNHNLYVIDTNLQKKKTISLDNISAKNNLTGRTISYSHDFKMFFLEKGLILNQIYFDNNWKVKLPMFVSLNIVNEKLTPLPISYSDYLYQIEGKAGYLTSIVTSEYQKKGRLTYSFLYESNIYQYNPKNSTITSYGAAPTKGKNLVDTIDYKDGDDPKKWVTHNIENTQFFNVMYDKFRHVYYRFSLRNISQNDGKYFNSILDKPLVLMVFNEKFEIIKELELPKYRYAPNTWFITREGLFISPTHKKNKFVDPSHLKFDIIKIYDSTVHDKNS